MPVARLRVRRSDQLDQQRSVADHCLTRNSSNTSARTWLAYVRGTSQLWASTSSG